MGQQQMMRRFAKWHIWLAWLAGVPILMWTVTGLVMVIKPIEEVRGNHLRYTVTERALPSDTEISVALPAESTRPVRSVTTQVERGETVTRITYMDGTSDRFRADGSEMGPISEVEARMIVAERIKGGDRVADTARYDADSVPFDFRREMPVWQVALTDGTHVYVGEHTGEIEAVRTQWWRTFDFVWGLHIMDLQTREDTSHPILILFAILGVLASLLGFVLMFRRRKARKV
ncbi:PepSY domain-containing protein [Qipengyuania nanhaisediminis]|uniref:PepSY-associated TM region n=1 Tax=Qipengyuania nanhaisediminis TaxID=604088 RepID=A0A1I5MAJ8_9SPHN|nr:PepSY domain-containing protein [Qipengyuania nanhaisediminis]SFP06051.1 PepSY-associated TM region [Qipengyuania nanhaisediminis]